MSILHARFSLRSSLLSLEDSRPTWVFLNIFFVQPECKLVGILLRHGRAFRDFHHVAHSTLHPCLRSLARAGEDGTPKLSLSKQKWREEVIMPVLPHCHMWVYEFRKALPSLRQVLRLQDNGRRHPSTPFCEDPKRNSHRIITHLSSFFFNRICFRFVD